MATPVLCNREILSINNIIFNRSPKLQHAIVTKAISLKRPKPIRPKSSKTSYEAYDEQAIPAQR